MIKLFLLIVCVAANARAAECGEMEVWDHVTAMCQAYPMAGMPMSMLMLHGNGFAVADVEEGRRGVNALSAPNMLMADLGTSFSERQYLNGEFMGTLERWTYPAGGYPELLQIGEDDQHGRPFVDAQHPHSSPVMGLTLSDTVAFGAEKNFVKLSFSPRGAATEGPIAFMHRPTGVVNPDAPLGHHVGQDVGHISSTVFAGTLRLGAFGLEVSTFYGREPAPEAVDLPMGNPDSYAARVSWWLGREWLAMASAATVNDPEGDGQRVRRYSASLYQDGETWHQAFVYGLANNYDGAPALDSFLYEALYDAKPLQFWGRIEDLRRTPAELQIGSSPEGKYVAALTVGFAREVHAWDATRLLAGASVTRDFLPADYAHAYGEQPWSARAFLRWTGMRMWEI